MTQGQHIQITAGAEDLRIARLAALAILLAVAEAGIPSPVPGIKPGLANIVTLLALERLGWRAAVWVSLLRVFGAGLALGGVFSPGFAMSLTGSLLSLLVLAAGCHLPRRWFGPVTLSILAAFAHIGGQLLLARLWLIPHNGLLYLLPLFASAALVFGLVNGLITARLLKEEIKKS
ncbi:MAG: heptaprenyl diphosphate synthase [Proteobacteria bacterium]|nr:heptaprenyl diphosphate synthase [Pseudomonadota bacterium]